MRFGELNNKAMEVNEVAYDLLDDIESSWLQKHKPRMQILLWSSLLTGIKRE